VSAHSPDRFDLASLYPVDLSTDAVDPVGDVTDEGDTVRVYAYSGPDGLRAAISTGKPVRFFARDSTRLTAEDVAVAAAVRPAPSDGLPRGRLTPTLDAGRRADACPAI